MGMMAGVRRALLSGGQAAAVVPWYLSGGILAANCIAAYQPKGAASLAASYVNLANPGTYDAAPVVAPTWDAVNGWVGDGTQYLNTGVVPAANYSMFVRFSGAPQNVYKALCGSYGGAGR